MLDAGLRDMLGAPLADAVDAARVRLADDAVMARCAEGLWSVETSAGVVEDGLAYDAAVASVEALEA